MSGRSDSGQAAALAGDSRFRLMFEQSADAILLLDTEANLFVEYNKAALEMMRCSRHELSSLHPSALSPPLQPDGRDSFEKANEMIAKAVQDGSNRFEWVHRSPHRDDFPVEVLLTPLSSGTNPMLLVVWRDITERKRDEAALRQAQRLESLGVMAGGLAHDFNNLLAAITGHVELAHRAAEDPATVRQHLDTIRLAVSHAADLTRQMLAYSGGGPSATEVVDVAATVREMLELLKASASGRGEVVLHLPSGPALIDGDRAQLQQVVLNLFTNAVEALGDRGGRVELEVGETRLEPAEVERDFVGQALSAGPYVTLAVRDTGHGMSPEVQARIFDPFFSTRQPGRGLGLSALRGILKGHRGGARIRSEVGVGTTFEVFLPKSTRPRPQPPARHAPVEGRGKGSVLLVDDNRGVRVSLGALSRELGFTVVEASGGREAIATYRERHAQLDWVLMDLTMPDLDGHTVFKALKEIDPGVVVVLSSGWAPADVLERFRESPPAALLAKPFTYEELRATLARIGVLRSPPR